VLTFGSTEEFIRIHLLLEGKGICAADPISWHRHWHSYISCQAIRVLTSVLLISAAETLSITWRGPEMGAGIS
jgi:hypothetical protein